MTIRQKIRAEVDSVPENELNGLLDVVKEFAQRSPEGSRDAESSSAEPTIFDMPLGVRIQGPRDFSENFELYASGEKRFEDDPGLR